MPRKHPVAFVQVLALAVRCLRVGVTWCYLALQVIRPTPADRSHAAEQLPCVQVLHLQLSSAPPPGRLPSVNGDRNGTCVQGTGARQKRGRSWLPFLTVACTACRLGKRNFCRYCHPKALPLVKYLCYSLIKKDRDLGDSSLKKRFRTVMGI